jgi:hypothetical protein
MFSEKEDPITPYPEPGGEGMTSGWSGSDTSHERAVREDESGVTSARQKMIYEYVAWWKGAGLTVKEIRESADLHHGQASSALSLLHKSGRIERLTERRNGCAVYVLPEYVGGRETAPHGRSRAAAGVPITLTGDQVVAISHLRARAEDDSQFTVVRHDALLSILELFPDL